MPRAGWPNGGSEPSLKIHTLRSGALRFRKTLQPFCGPSQHVTGGCCCLSPGGQIRCPPPLGVSAPWAPSSPCVTLPWEGPQLVFSDDLVFKKMPYPPPPPGEVNAHGCLPTPKADVLFCWKGHSGCPLEVDTTRWGVSKSGWVGGLSAMARVYFSFKEGFG